jgi:hypothetical protein
MQNTKTTAAAAALKKAARLVRVAPGAPATADPGQQRGAITTATLPSTNKADITKVDSDKETGSGGADMVTTTPGTATATLTTFHAEVESEGIELVPTVTAAVVSTLFAVFAVVSKQ